MNTDLQENDIMPYLKKRNKPKGSAKPFLLILIIGALALLTFVIYRSGKELFSFLGGEITTEESTTASSSSATEQTTLGVTDEVPADARKILKTDMSAAALGKLYENETSLDIFPSSYEFVRSPEEEISVLVLCSRGFETYLAEECFYMDGDYPAGAQTVGVSVCARNIAANLTLAGVGALYIDVGNTSAYGSYENTAHKIRECLALYPSIKYVIDVRRGVYYGSEGDLIAPSFSRDGADTAQMRFILSSESALFSTELNAAQALFSALREQSPLCVMPTRIKSGKLASAREVPVITLEIGSAVTPQKEALAAAEMFAKTFAEITKW